MSEPIRIFVNGIGGSVPHGSTVLDAVASVDPAAADAVTDGSRRVVDSRGLPVTADTPVTGGFVMRIVSARSMPGDEA